jgi:N-hydroxyarylamine O-acetyltransferase
MNLNLANYLKRISFQDEVQINLDTLIKLHTKHLQRVPFENLDIHHGKKISLVLKMLETKIVTHLRGGFCYELNGLFGALLQQLGFDVKLISALVYRGNNIGQEFDHLALIVRFGEEWLVDVGFGDSFLEPMRIKTGVIHADPAGQFRIEKHNSQYLRLAAYQESSGFLPQYLFTKTARKLEDFWQMCEYHQTSPVSPFTRGQVCTIATETGRITVRTQGTDRKLIETKHSRRTERTILSEAEYQRLLQERFGVVIR